MLASTDTGNVRVEGHAAGESIERPTDTPAPLIPALTGSRFVAALLVVLYHFAQPTFVPNFAPLGNAIRQGFLGVSFFFVLSGFVLVHAHKGPTVDPKSFWRRRAARILPGYLLAFVLAAPPVIAHHLDASGTWVGSLKIAVATAVNVLLLQSVLPFASSAWNFPSWSVSVEAFFYAIFPWLLPKLRRGRPRSALAGIFICAGCAALFPGLALIMGDSRMLPAQEHWRAFPLLHLPAFVAGMCLRRALDDAWLFTWLRRHQRILVPCGFGLAAAGFCVDSSALGPLQGHVHILGWVCFIAVVSAARSVDLPGTKSMVSLGEASYALYILQAPLWIMFLALGGDRSSLVDLVAYLVVLVAASLVVRVYFEEPVRRWMRTAPVKLPLVR